MGVYYYYCNLDREEYFSIGLGREAVKRSGLGRGRGARALSLLLLPGGRWAGQQIRVLGDDSPLPAELQELASPGDTCFDWLRANFRDVRVLALRALLQGDPKDMAEAVEGGDAILGELLFFAEQGDSHCQSFLSTTYGKGWRKLLKGESACSEITQRILARALPLPE